MTIGPEVTDVQRNQIMGHARADVFRKHYLRSTVKVDTQSAYLGTVSRADLIRNIGLMSANRDLRAPVRLKPGFKLDNHPEIAALKAERDGMGWSLRAEYGTLKASESAFPAGHEAYMAAKRKLNARKVSIKRAELEQSRKTFFERVDHEEIQHQLRGAEASTFTYTEPKLCPLRTLVATYHKGGSDISWADALRSLTDICLQKPTVHRSAAWKAPMDNTTSGTRLCPFCVFDKQTQQADREHEFHSVATLRKHISRRHAEPTTSTKPIGCPFEQCVDELDDGEHLKSHLSVSHGLQLYT